MICRDCKKSFFSASIDENLCDECRKKREDVAGDILSGLFGGATIFEPSDESATILETADETVLESSSAEATIAETVFEEQTNPTKSEENSFYKGGMLLNTYRVDSDPIQGGMGSVWRVYHQNWDVELAMKRPKKEFFITEAQKENFTNECKSWIELGLHPNIVSCYYVRDIEGIPTIFSEWMENGSLENHIKDKTLYEGLEQEIQKRLLDISIQFAYGLNYAHKRGLIHQDVKPDNLLLTYNWNAKVSDFGLAKARSVLSVTKETDSKNPNATIMAPTGGMTPAYCSPEQSSSRPLTRRTDIYSWAVSILEMYMGYKPWAHGSEKTGPMVGFVCEDYFDSCYVSIPESMKRVLKKCLQQNPENRYKDFDEVISELKTVYKEVTGEEYFRNESDSAKNTGGSLNNRALSYLDLGQTEEAKKLFYEASKLDNKNNYVLINQTFLFWRDGRINDLEAYSKFTEIDDVTLKERVIADFERERGMKIPFEYPAPIVGEDKGTPIVETSAVRIDGNVISFVVRIKESGNIFNAVKKYDVLSGKLLEEYPKEQEKACIPCDDDEFMTGLTKNGSEMFIVKYGKKAKLWDVKKQIVVRVYNSESEYPKEFPSVLPVRRGRMKTKDGMDIYMEAGVDKIYAYTPNYRCLCTIKLPRITDYTKEGVRGGIPNLYSDAESERLVLCDTGYEKAFWYIIDTPHDNTAAAPYYIERFVDVDTALKNEKLIEDYKKTFDNAYSLQDTKTMLEIYNKARALPSMEGDDFVIKMNEKLIQYCSPTAIAGIREVYKGSSGYKNWHNRTDYLINGKSHLIFSDNTMSFIYMDQGKPPVYKLPADEQQKALEKYDSFIVERCSEDGNVSQKTVKINDCGKWLKCIHAVSHNGRYALLEIRGHSGSEYEVILKDIFTGEEKAIYKRGDGINPFYHIVFSNEPIAMRWIKENKYTSIKVYHLDTGKESSISLDNMSLTSLTLSEDESCLIAVSETEDYKKRVSIYNFYEKKWVHLYEGKNFKKVFTSYNMDFVFIKESGFSDPDCLLIYGVKDGQCIYKITDNVARIDWIKSISKDMTYFLSEEYGPKSYAIEWDYE